MYACFISLMYLYNRVTYLVNSGLLFTPSGPKLESEGSQVWFQLGQGAVVH